MNQSPSTCSRKLCSMKSKVPDMNDAQRLRGLEAADNQFLQFTAFLSRVAQQVPHPSRFEGCVLRMPFYETLRHCYTTRVRMSVAETRVRWTGHLSLGNLKELRALFFA